MIFPALPVWSRRKVIGRISVNRKSALVVAVFSLVLTLGAFGQVEDTKEKPPHWKGDVSLGLSLARGNARSTTFSFTFAADGPVNKTNTLISTNKAIYLFGEMDGETSAENLLLASRLDWLHTARFYSYFEVQGIRDRFKNYSSRILPSIGAGYKVIAEETVTLGLDVGLTQVITRYYDSGDTRNYTGLKFGEQLNWQISGTSEFNEKVEVAPDISEFRKYFLRFEANLITAIAESWSVKLTFIDNYDNRPVGPDIKKNDVTFIAGLSRKF
jgi:putative salt-induced outer membrane protein YdiY